ncbi:hypothetical protein D3C80_1448670 [compost metagenome]
MEGNRSRHRCAVAGQLQSAATAEAEAEGGELCGIQRRLASLSLQRHEGTLHAAAQQRTVVLHRHHRGAGFVSVLRTHLGAIQVGDEHHVILAGNLFGDVDGALADAHPVRRHHQAGTRRAARRVIHELAFEGLAIDFVGDCLNGDLTHAGIPFFFYGVGIVQSPQ